METVLTLTEKQSAVLSSALFTAIEMWRRDAFVAEDGEFPRLARQFKDQIAEAEKLREEIES